LAAKFRLASIALDDDEKVTAITVVTSTATLAVIHGIIPVVEWTVRSETESGITLPVQDMLTLFREAGKTTGTDPRYEHLCEIWDRLSRVVYRLMEDD
jgi:hypothetical protein